MAPLDALLHVPTTNNQHVHVSPQAPLAAVVAAAQKAQHDFCVQWRAGVPRPAGLPPNETYTRVEGVPAGLGSAGFDMPYYVLSSADIVSGEIQSSKTWERSDTAAVLGKLQEWRGARGDDVVLFDVGANLGWFAINAAALGYTVFAFEPVDYNIGAIRRTLCEAPPQLQSRFTLVTQARSWLGLFGCTSRCDPQSHAWPLVRCLHILLSLCYCCSRA